MKIIGIVGYAGSGKDTVASLLALKLKPKTSKIVHFADPLKNIATNLGWNGKKDKKGRKLLQLLGTDVCRDCIDGEYWVKCMQEVISRETVKGTHYLLMPDVRFANEAEMFQDTNSRLFVIKRPVKGFWKRFMVFITPRHKSEQYQKWINKYHYTTIDNTGSIEDLEKILDKIVPTL